MYDDTDFKNTLAESFRSDHAQPGFWRELTGQAVEFLRREQNAVIQRSHEACLTALVVCLLAAFAALWYVVELGLERATFMAGPTFVLLAVLAVGLFAMGEATSRLGKNTELRALLNPLLDTPHHQADALELREFRSVRDFHDAVLAQGRELTYGDFLRMLHLALEEKEVPAGHLQQAPAPQLAAGLQ